MKVLIVDDEPDVRALVRSSLSYARQDLTAIEASDGDEVLAMIFSERPDLVVLDLATAGAQPVTISDTSDDEHPSFAPKNAA